MAWTAESACTGRLEWCSGAAVAKAVVGSEMGRRRRPHGVAGGIFGEEPEPTTRSTASEQREATTWSGGGWPGVPAAARGRSA